MRLITLIGLMLFLAKDASAQWTQSCSDALNGYLRARVNASLAVNLPQIDTTMVREAEKSLGANAQVLSSHECMSTLFIKLESSSDSEEWYNLYMEAVYYSKFKKLPPPPKAPMPIAWGLLFTSNLCGETWRGLAG